MRNSTKNRFFYLFVMLFSFSTTLFSQKHYHLVIDSAQLFINPTYPTIQINGQFSGPTLFLDRKTGNTIKVTNHLKNPIAIHWGGIKTTPRQSGLAYTNSLAIEPGQSKTYTLNTEQEGTFSYYATTSTHKQQGLYGAIVVKDKMAQNTQYQEERVLVLSDYTALSTEDILHTLKRNSRWYNYKKKQTNTAFDYLKKGLFWDRLKMAFHKVPASGISEIPQEYAFINGDTSLQIIGCKQNSKLLFRIANTASSSNFTLKFSGNKLNIIAADGLPIDTQVVDQLPIAIGETYDLFIEMPSDTLAYELKALSHDGTLSTSILFGDSALIHGDSSFILAQNIQKQNIYKSSSLKGISWEKEKEIYKTIDTTGMNKIEQMGAARDQYLNAREAGNVDSLLREQELVLNYHMLKALDSTQIDSTKPTRIVKMKLVGNPQRYVWGIASNQLNSKGEITIAKGEKVILDIKNKTAMHQPIHFGGHYFRVVNAQGKYSPLKHSINIKPLDHIILELEAENEKTWRIDGTMLYRNHTGLTQEVSYEGTAIDSDVAAASKKHHAQKASERFDYGQIGLMYNMGDFIYNNTTHKTALNIDFETDYRFYFETDIDYSYYFGKSQQVSAFGGLFMNGGDNRAYIIDSNDVTAKFKVFPKAVIGLRYVLPLFINAEARINHDLDVRLEFSGKIPLFPYVNLRYRANTDKEWQLMLEGRIIKRASVLMSIDHLYGFGLGGAWKF